MTRYDASSVGRTAQALKQNADSFLLDAHRIVGRFETATSTRIFTLTESRKKLTSLSLQQHNLFDEALSCVEHGLFRAAHVSAWQAFMDVLEAKIASDGLVRLHANYPKWSKFGSIDELREQIPEFQIIDAARSLRLINRNGAKSLQGHLSTRNDCAHPSSYNPSLNATLGYVADLIDRIEELQRTSL